MSAIKGKVKLKFSSSFAAMLNIKAASLVGLEYDMADGATVGSILAELVKTYPSLKSYLFNPEGTGASERIDFVLNKSLIKNEEVLITKLCDGDTLFLLPVYEGG